MLSPWAFREQYLFTDKCNNNMKYNIQKIVLSRIGETQCFGTRLSISTIKSWAFKELPVSHIRSATSGEAVGQFSPEIFTNVLYLLGAATSYIILPPPKISVGCGPVSHITQMSMVQGGASASPNVLICWKFKKKLKKIGHRGFDTFENINEIILFHYWLYK